MDRPDFNNKNDDTNRIEAIIPHRPLDTENFKAKELQGTSGQQGSNENSTARRESTKPEKVSNTILCIMVTDVKILEANGLICASTSMKVKIEILV